LNKSIYEIKGLKVIEDKKNFVAVLDAQCQFSFTTYGPPRGTTGVLAHIDKELVEIREDPSDITEWIDLAILAFDGAYRSGATPQMIYDTYITKMEKNMSRQWPDWRTSEPGKPIEHIKGIND
jgi:hypothetical protein